MSCQQSVLSLSPQSNNSALPQQGITLIGHLDGTPESGFYMAKEGVRIYITPPSKTWRPAPQELYMVRVNEQYVSKRGNPYFKGTLLGRVTNEMMQRLKLMNSIPVVNQPRGDYLLTKTLVLPCPNNNSGDFLNHIKAQAHLTRPYGSRSFSIIKVAPSSSNGIAVQIAYHHADDGQFPINPSELEYFDNALSDFDQWLKQQDTTQPNIQQAGELIELLTGKIINDRARGYIQSRITDFWKRNIDLGDRRSLFIIPHFQPHSKNLYQIQGFMGVVEQQLTEEMMITHHSLHFYWLEKLSNKSDLDRLIRSSQLCPDDQHRWVQENDGLSQRLRQALYERDIYFSTKRKRIYICVNCGAFRWADYA